MELSFEALKQEVAQKGLNLSHQRLKVFEYLHMNRCHPTADEIFGNLKKDIPTLSKTTVYNTLRLLVSAKLVRMINIEDNEIRYDIETENHGHFKCQSCGTIYNFGINTDLLKSDELNGFKVDDKNVYFKGTCSRCLLNINEHVKPE